MTTWGLITFAPIPDHLRRLRDFVPGFQRLRIQASRSFAAHMHEPPEPVSFAVATLTGAMEAGYDVLWGPLDNPSDFQGAHRYVAQVLDLLERIPAGDGELLGVIFDAETRDDRYAPQPGVESYVHYLAPAITEVNARGIPTYGPGSTHSDHDDWFRILEALPPEAMPAVPSIHAYPDIGWKKLERRNQEIAHALEDIGYSRGAITETGVHGKYAARLDGFKCRKPDPSRAKQHRRAAELKSRLRGDPFWTELFYYQVLDPPEDRAGFGLLDTHWNPKPVADLWRHPASTP